MNTRYCFGGGGRKLHFSIQLHYLLSAKYYPNLDLDIKIFPRFILSLVSLPLPDHIFDEPSREISLKTTLAFR